MLSNQLLSRAEVSRLVASYALLAGHQHVEEVVDHDRHLDTLNRGEHTSILRQRPPAPTKLTTETRHRSRCMSPRCGRAAMAVPMLLRNEGLVFQRAR
jgi:hypothetical protein